MKKKLFYLGLCAISLLSSCSSGNPQRGYQKFLDVHNFLGSEGYNYGEIISCEYVLIEEDSKAKNLSGNIYYEIVSKAENNTTIAGSRWDYFKQYFFYDLKKDTVLYCESFIYQYAMDLVKDNSLKGKTGTLLEMKEEDKSSPASN